MNKYQGSSILENLKKHQFLIHQLVKVNLLSDVKLSLLGWTWYIVLPILSVIIWIFMKGGGVIEPGVMSIPYPVFVFISTTLWGLFFEVYLKISRIFIANAGVILAHKVPFEVFFTIGLLVKLLRFIIPLVISIIVMLVYQVFPDPLAIFFPIFVLPLVGAGFCLGLITGLIRALAKDIAQMIDEVIKLLIFVTPVLYSMDVQSGILATIVTYNPLSYLIEAPRQLIFHGVVPNWEIYLGLSVGLLVLSTLILQIFLKLAPRIPERIIQI